MGEMLTIRELAKRFDDSEQTVRRTLRKLIQAGRLKPDADFRIENEDDVHHRVYFAVPSRFRDEAVEMSPKSGLGRKLISLRGESDISNGDIRRESDTTLISGPEVEKPTGSASEDGVADIKSPDSDIRKESPDIKQGDINDPTWRPFGFVAFLLEAKDAVIAAKEHVIDTLGRQVEQQRVQIGNMTTTIRQQQQMLNATAEENEELRRRIEALPPLAGPIAKTPRAARDADVVDSVDNDDADHDERASEPAPELKDLWVGPGLSLTLEQAIHELFELYRIILRAEELGDDGPDVSVLTDVLRRLEELSQGLTHDEWRNHAASLHERTAAVISS